MPTIILFVISVAFADKLQEKSYLGYKAYSVTPENNNQLNILGELLEKSEVSILLPISLGKPTTLVVSPILDSKIRELLKANKLDYSAVLQDVGEYFKKQKEKNDQAQKRNKRELFVPKNYLYSYLRYPELEELLLNISLTYDTLTRLDVLSISHEDRPIYILKISDRFSEKRPVAMFEAGMHARERITIPVALYMIDYLLTTPVVREGIEFQFIVLANPDGYEYTFDVDPLWKKTRSSHGNNCYGVDGSRNFNFHWGEVGSSNDPCSDIYHGPFPFSERETQAIRTAMREVKSRLKLYFSIHSYGPSILYPNGYTTALNKDNALMEALAYDGAKRIRENPNNRRVNFTMGTTGRLLYPTGAGAEDYAKYFTQAVFTYNVQLNAGGTGGFDPAPEEIKDIIEPAGDGMIEMCTTFHDALFHTGTKYGEKKLFEVLGDNARALYDYVAQGGNLTGAAGK